MSKRAVIRRSSTSSLHPPEISRPSFSCFSLSHTHPSTCSHRLMLLLHPRTHVLSPISEVKIHPSRMLSSFKFHSAHPCQPSSETFLRPSSVPRSRRLGISLTQRLTAGARSGTLALPSTVPPTSRDGGTRTAVPPQCDLGIVPESLSMIEPTFSDMPAHPCQQYPPVFCV